MNIRLAGNTDAPHWDAFVESHQDASPYHLWAWKEAVEDAYSHKGYYFLAEENGVINGIFPLIHMKVHFLSNQLVSLPFCDIGGCLANSPETEALLINEAMMIGTELKASTIDIRTKSSLVQSANRQTSVSCDKVSMFLELPMGSEILWGKFKSKLRSQIHRSSKNGLQFTWGGGQDAVNQFYDVFSSNMRELGSPVHSKWWIQAILNHYGDAARMGLIHKDGAAIGCGIILMTGKRISIPWASTLREYNSLSPNMLLYWSFLKYAADSGHERFDFGRSTPGEGTYKFKAQWGAEPQALYWHIVYLNGQSAKSASEASKSNGKRERLASLWARLPLWAANFLGPCLRRYISL
ncbi:MAG: FemAB family PEP-CTERM system-associated protein [Proteobacteria bacterium]|nr:FemAB family PEP-CTERM system-associated protein [Pseudomonadota bacterium]